MLRFFNQDQSQPSPSQLADTRLFSWGQGGNSCLGTTPDTDVMSPTPVQFFERRIVKKISAGSCHSCAITADDSLYIWGRGSSYRLGQGGDSTRNIPQPQRLQLPDRCKSVSAGNLVTAAILESGQVLAWGGKFGSLPAQIWTNGQVSKIAAGDDFFAMLLEDGQVALAGFDSEIPKVTYVSLPSVALRISCGFGHIAVILSNFELWTWGSCTYGEAGHGAIVEKIPAPRRVETLVGKRVVKVSCGNDFTHAIVDNNGVREVWSFGSNRYGQLGISEASKSSASKKTELYLSPTFNPYLSNIKSISCGATFTLALNYNGDVYGFGKSKGGSLGFGDLSGGKKEHIQYLPRGLDSFNQGNFVKNISTRGYHVLAIVGPQSLKQSTPIPVAIQQQKQQPPQSTTTQQPSTTVTPSPTQPQQDQLSQNLQYQQQQYLQYLQQYQQQYQQQHQHQQSLQQRLHQSSDRYPQQSPSLSSPALLPSETSQSGQLFHSLPSSHQPSLLQSAFGSVPSTTVPSSLSSSSSSTSTTAVPSVVTLNAGWIRIDDSVSRFVRAAEGSNDYQNGFGDTYQGDILENGLPHGQGLVRYWDKTGSWKGGFRFGEKHGVGTFVWPDGRRTLRQYHRDQFITERDLGEQASASEEMINLREQISQLEMGINQEQIARRTEREQAQREREQALGEKENLLQKQNQDLEALKTQTQTQIKQLNERVEALNEKMLCIICMERERDTVLMPCMHFLMCLQCIESSQQKSCPYCRTPTHGKLQLSLPRS